MRLRLGTLRTLLLNEIGNIGGFPGQPYRNALSPDRNDRESLESLAQKPVDAQDDDDDLPEHLRDPTVTPEECYGPVPPSTEQPGVYSDPLATDTSPQPFSGGGRIKRG